MTTSDGLSLPGTYPACHAARSAARCAATSSGDHRCWSPLFAASHHSAAVTFPTISVCAGYTWSVLGVVSTCRTGVVMRQGVMSATGSNPAVTIRSALASRSQITWWPAMSSTPAKYGWSSLSTPLAIAPTTTGSPACSARVASAADAPQRTAPAPASRTGRRAVRSGDSPP